MRVKSSLLPIVVVVSLFHCSIQNVYAACSESLLSTKQSATQEPRKEKYLRAEDVVDLTEISKMAKTNKAEKRTREILAIVKKHDIDTLSYDNLLRVVAFVKSSKAAIARLLEGEESIYIHPSPIGVIIPVQFYRNGHIYLHLKKFDSHRKQGGFKFFSRSVDYHKVSLFANLVMTISQKNDVQNFFSELEKMYLLRSETNLLHYRDISSYVGYNQKVLRQKVAFQSELFTGDLVQVPKEWEESKGLAKGFLAAVQALQDLHRYQVFHRDLKPGNFFVRHRSGLSSLVLADFGLSQQVGEEKFCHSIAGTRGYIAPELCRSVHETGRPCTSWAEVAAADTFALGMTFYTLLFGKDNTFKHHVTVLNEIVLPRKNIPAARTQLSVPAALDAVDAAYQEVLKHTREAPAGDSIRKGLLMLMVRALAPKPEQRISLAQLKAGLGKL